MITGGGASHDSAHTMEEALNKAKAMVNKEDYKVTVIPDGVSVIVRG